MAVVVTNDVWAPAVTATIELLDSHLRPFNVVNINGSKLRYLVKPTSVGYTSMVFWIPGALPGEHFVFMDRTYRKPNPIDNAQILLLRQQLKSEFSRSVLGQKVDWKLEDTEELSRYISAALGDVDYEWIPVCMAFEFQVSIGKYRYMFAQNRLIPRDLALRTCVHGLVRY